jgi:hypothetical protein
MVQRVLLCIVKRLMAALDAYVCGLTAETSEQYFMDTPDSLTNLAHSVVNEPLRRLGITEDWRLGYVYKNK